jgi:hypothetical protein
VKKGGGGAFYYYFLFQWQCKIAHHIKNKNQERKFVLESGRGDIVFWKLLAFYIQNLRQEMIPRKWCSILTNT